MVSEGIITVAQAGGSGLQGDFNGDGAVTTADLILLLSSFNTFGLGFNSSVKVLSAAGDTVTGLAPVSQSASAWPVAFSALTGFNFPSTYTIDSVVYGWSSASAAVNAANEVTLTDITIDAENVATHYGIRHLRIRVDATVNASQAEYVVAYALVTLTFNNATDYTAAYALANDTGFTGGLIGASGGGYGNAIGEIGEDIPVSFYFSSEVIGTLGVEPVDISGVSANLNDPWALGITAAAAGGGNAAHYISDIKVNIAWASANEAVSVAVNQVTLFTDASPIYTQ